MTDPTDQPGPAEPAAAVAVSLVRPRLAALGVALVCWAVVWVRFSPALFRWRALLSPVYNFAPEANRAWYVLQQVNNPFMVITDETNRVIAWRVLLPLLTHYLHLPRLTVIVVPMLGVGVLLWQWLRVLRGRGVAWSDAVSVVVLAGASGAVFVAMDWLSYPDAWTLAGLTVLAFGSPRWIILAGVACPWVDERFVLLAPLALVIRAVDAGQRGEPVGWRPLLADAAGCVGGCGAYLGIRLVVTALGIRPGIDLAAKVHADWAGTEHAGLVLADALWQSLRLGWLPVVIGIVALVRLAPRRWRWPAILTLAWAVFVCVVLAGDLSRSLGYLVLLALPAVVWGKLPRRRWLLPVLAAGQLVLPAAHVGLLNWRYPIEPLPVALHDLAHPPYVLTGAHHVELAIEAYNAHDPERASALARAALKLSPEDDAVAETAGLLLARCGHPDEALPVVRRALAANPTADRYYAVAFVCQALGDTPAYRANLVKALEVAPADWPSAASARQRLEELDQGGGGH